MSLANAQHEGFVDFYELLGMGREASTIQLRSRINEMYGEAQANRDHRNPDKRQEYQSLLHWLPVCRAVLLHEGRRAKYEYYIDNAQGENESEFKSFINTLTGAADVMPGGDAPLGVKARPAANGTTPEKPLEKAPRSIPTPQTATSTTKTASVAAPTLKHTTPLPTTPLPPPQPRPVVEEKPAKPLPTALTTPALRRELMSLLSSAAGVSVGFIIFILARAALGLNFFACSVPSFIIGFLIWRGMHDALVEPEASAQ